MRILYRTQDVCLFIVSRKFVVYTLTNGIRKNAYGAVWSLSAAKKSSYPSIAIEVSYSDSMSVTPGKIRQWLDFTNCEVPSPFGIVTDVVDTIRD